MKATLNTNKLQLKLLICLRVKYVNITRNQRVRNLQTTAEIIDLSLADKDLNNLNQPLYMFNPVANEIYK